ncbi:MAG TPA: VWA domain-containing protein [Edaphobacter sp.]|nr:VWA domain-containing protein [Edaphobacter sp.]
MGFLWGGRAGKIWIAAVLGISLTSASLGDGLGQQQAPDSDRPFTLPVYVDEVNVSFSATDEDGRWIDDLELADLRVKDNHRAPERIVSFRKMTGLPVQAGVLVDSSRSMLGDLRRNRRIVSQLAEQMLRLTSDRAFVAEFDFEYRMKQPWTSDKAQLNARMSVVGRDWASRLGGTAIFDSVYRACRDQFGGTEADKAGNFILLFSDGLDNASHARMMDVIDRCQRSHTAIYVFSDERKPSRNSGERVLRELADKSGGRVFYDQDAETQLRDLKQIEGEVRNQYRVIYKPAGLKPDGSFHSIRIDCPERTAQVHAREGYYAPEKASR